MTLKFSKFIKDNEERILKVANTLSKFKIDSLNIGIKEARMKILKWLENFDNIDYTDFNYPLILLEKLEFIGTEEITQKVISLGRVEIANLNNIIAPLGETNESSFRITSALHKNINFYAKIIEALDAIDIIHNTKLLLFDDFLNSGGQLISIFYALLDLPLPNGAINDEVDKRSKLNTEQIQKLKKIEIHIYYFQAFEEGINSVTNELKTKLGINVKIHPYFATTNNEGAFGDSQDQENIIEFSDGKLNYKSAFNGHSYRDISPFYNILINIGELLLRNSEKHWNEGKIVSRRLGYGNLARLIITDTNIPTVTITCLWQSGKIDYDNRQINWEPLLSRNKKVIFNRKVQVKNGSKENSVFKESINIIENSNTKNESTNSKGYNLNIQNLFKENKITEAAQNIIKIKLYELKVTNMDELIALQKQISSYFEMENRNTGILKQMVRKFLSEIEC